MWISAVSLRTESLSHQGMPATMASTCRLSLPVRHTSLLKTERSQSASLQQRSVSVETGFGGVDFEYGGLSMRLKVAGLVLGCFGHELHP